MTMRPQDARQAEKMMLDAVEKVVGEPFEVTTMDPGLHDGNIIRRSFTTGELWRIADAIIHETTIECI